MRGCVAKVRASELVSESEERSNPVLRAMLAFQEDVDEVQPRREGRRSFGGSATGHLRKRGANRSTPCASPTAIHHSQARCAGDAVATTCMAGLPNSRLGTPPQLKGRIVRDDFSDDSDDSGLESVVAASRSPQIAPMVKAAPAVAGRPRSGCVGGADVPMATAGWPKARLGPPRLKGGELAPLAAPVSLPTLRPCTPTKLKGRIVRDDFSDDSLDNG